MKKQLITFLFFVFPLFANSQNVGISTISPIEKLHVGDLSGPPTNNYIFIGSPGANSSVSGLKLRHFSDDYGFTIESNDIIGSQGLIFRRHVDSSLGIADMIIDMSGKIGIGQLIPSEKLDVEGGIKADSIDVSSGLIKNVADPISAQDATTKAYVDNLLLQFGISIGPPGIQGLLNTGYSPLEIINQGIPPEDFMGLNYQGGIIFYMEMDGTGLVAAPTDQSPGSEWGCLGTDITGADGTAIGTGSQNTMDIVAGCTNIDIAADLCINLSLNGYSDWFLPSRDELYEMFVKIGNSDNIGGFADSFYWSSSEYDDTYAWIQNLLEGFVEGGIKANSNRVRAIRAF